MNPHPATASNDPAPKANAPSAHATGLTVRAATDPQARAPPATDRAQAQPPHLAAINPWEGFSDWYREFGLHGGMRDTLARLLHPLNLAGLATWLAVAMSLRGSTPGWQIDALLVAWLLAFLGSNTACDRRPLLRIACFDALLNSLQCTHGMTKG